MSIFVWIALLAGGFSFILSGVCFVWLIVYDENIKRVGRIADNLHDRMVTINHTATERLAAEGAVVCLLAEFGYNIWKIEWSDCGRVMEIYCNQTTGSATEGSK